MISGLGGVLYRGGPGPYTERDLDPVQMGWALYSKNIASWDKMMDRHDWKHYLPATSLAHGKNLNRKLENSYTWWNSTLQVKSLSKNTLLKIDTGSTFFDNKLFNMKFALLFINGDVLCTGHLKHSRVFPNAISANWYFYWPNTNTLIASLCSYRKIKFSGKLLEKNKCFCTSSRLHPKIRKMAWYHKKNIQHITK